MTCHDARELFSALADEALGAAERADLEAHLAGCAECRRELASFRSTVVLLHRVAPERAPAGFVDRVLAAARPAPWYRRLARTLFLPWPVKLPLEAAAIVLVGVIVTLVYRQTPELHQAARLESEPPAVSEAPPQPAPRPAAPAPRPAAPQFAAPGPSVAPAPPPERKAASAEAESRLAAKPEGTPPAADERDTPGKREERANVRDEAEAARRQDAAKAAPAPRAATAPAVLAPAAPRREKATGAPAALDVTGRWSVADRDAASGALGDLLARAGGREVARRATPDGLVIELAIPRAGWADFARELARLGRFTPEFQAAELPDQVRVSLRITD
jgi:hypothetical protein